MLCKDPDRQAFSLHFVCQCLKSDQVLLKNLGPNSLKSEWPHQTDWWMHLIKTPFPCQTRLWCQYCVNGLFGLLPHQFLPRKSFPTKSKVQGHEMNFTQLEDGKKVSQEEPTFQKSYCANRKRTCRTQNTNNNSLFFQKWDHFGVIIKHCENSKFL